MIISLAEDFDLASGDEAANLLDESIVPFFGLFEPGASNR